ncbi:hypothetical protein NNJEOMEG_03827 [Fundidesulfovibrio magnetotacticus]|uniref:FlgD Ig-like domain-containing protein n=1 Tax=Fundidesulfovibrio magnetotacticus TaxID=2730080 RepID=A0A6V8LW41_9BACT|nr:hypothetical protein [Fundidesulfovibrio magnetotacticus]GFK95954.1 hypothetical protein NNJEOMEG_03827 [Fundidesulfovibrio magnetotacticus]
MRLPMLLLVFLLALPALALGQFRDPDDDPDPDPAQQTGQRQPAEPSLPLPTPAKPTVAGCTVTSFLFYEGPETGPAQGMRVYATSFPAARARFIYFELVLTDSSPATQAKRLDILAVCARSNGREVFRVQRQFRHESGWSSSTHSFGWGNETPGVWTPGDYTLKLYYEGREIAAGSFRIT